MLYVNGEQFTIPENQVKKYTAPHTWAIDPHKIRFDYANKRIQCPDVGVPTEYRAFFAIGNESKRAHTVQYSRGTVPHPNRGNMTIHTPQMLMITDGYMLEGSQTCTDQELNWFLTHAPWYGDGVAYNKGRKLICLYKRKNVAEKAETETELMWKMINKAMGMKDNEIIAKAKGILKDAKIREKFFELREEVLENKASEEYPTEISLLKTGIIRFIQAYPRHAQNIFQGKEVIALTTIEKARSMEVLYFDTEQPQEGFQGSWKFSPDPDKDPKFICTATTSERPLEALTNFLLSNKAGDMVNEIERACDKTLKSA